MPSGFFFRVKKFFISYSQKVLSALGNVRFFFVRGVMRFFSLSGTRKKKEAISGTKVLLGQKSCLTRQLPELGDF